MDILAFGHHCPEATHTLDRGKLSMYPYYALHTLYLFCFYIKVTGLFLVVEANLLRGAVAQLVEA